MPHKNGLDNVKEVRKFYKEISNLMKDTVLIEPIYIFLTTFGESKAFEDLSLKTGVDLVYFKPLTSQQLLLLSQLLE
jgi:hypothetical protein